MHNNKDQGRGERGPKARSQVELQVDDTERRLPGGVGSVNEENRPNCRPKAAGETQGWFGGRAAANWRDRRDLEKRLTITLAGDGSPPDPAAADVELKV